jgi:hypothetical protein
VLGVPLTLEQCQQALAVAQRENLLLRQKIDALARRIFGVSSEALDPAQLQLLLQMPELKPVETAPVVFEKPKPIVAVRKHRKAPRLPESIADTRTHGTTRRQVGKVFEEVERPALQPLPAGLFPVFEGARRTVHRDG